MTDPTLVAKKLAMIETRVRELKNVVRIDEIPHDVREERFALYTLQTAIQATLDVASHIVSDERLGEPATNRALFAALARAAWIPEQLAETLAGMAGFRNVLVHGYADVDLAIVDDVLRRHLDDLLSFVEQVRARLDPPVR